MIEITFHCSSTEEAAALFAKLNAPGVLAGPDEYAAAGKDPDHVPAGTVTRTRKPKPAKDVPQVTNSEEAMAAAGAAMHAAAQVAPAPAPAPAAAPAANRYQSEIQPLVVKAAQAAGTDKVFALMQTFGVRRGQDVPADRLDELETGLRALISPAPTEEALL